MLSSGRAMGIGGAGGVSAGMGFAMRVPARRLLHLAHTLMRSAMVMTIPVTVLMAPVTVFVAIPVAVSMTMASVMPTGLCNRRGVPRARGSGHQP